MQVLINDLLAFSRAATKKRPFSPVDLNTTVAEVINDLEVGIAEQSAQVNSAALPALHADPVQMRQLFQNLISNALRYKHHDRAPRVDITALVTEINQHTRNECQITVRDNGIGFDEKHAERIFGIFQRLHGREEYAGTGVGLAICRKICDRHRGTIVAHSVPDSGAAFVITLPMSHAQEEPDHD